MTVESQNWSELVGKYFHTFCAGHSIEQQGYVKAALGGGYYVIQLFEWLGGGESHVGTRVVHISRIASEGWALYPSADAMNESYQYSGSAHTDRKCRCEQTLVPVA